MNYVTGKPERKGSQGRVADAAMDEYERYIREAVTIPPDVDRRLIKYAKEQERAKSWVVSKALDAWLTEQGY